MSKISKVYIPSNDEFEKIISESESYSECLRKLGLSTSGGSSTDTLKKRIKELNCDTSHFIRGRTNDNIGKIKYSIEEILVEDSSYANIASLKKRLIKENILEYKCEKCGNKGEWMGEPLSLQLDHKDGNNRNHTRENLRFLCPNCHAQTLTFSGKNKK